MSSLATLRLRRAALRLDIASARMTTAGSCERLRAGAKAISLGVSLARLAARAFLRRRNSASG